VTVTVTLDDFVFQDFEVPEELPFGGAQMLAKKQLLGGERQIDAMGADDEPIEWTGRFRGADAVSRARSLDAKRRAGKALTLTWGEFTYSVVIARFRPVYQRAGLEIPYTIVLEVVDAPQPDDGPDAHEMMLQDNATAQAQGAAHGDSKLGGLLGSLDSAIGKVSDFAKATTSTINSVLEPIRAVQSRVTTLLGAAEGTLAQVTTLGGIVPNNPISQQVARLSGQANAALQCSQLYGLQHTLGRMSANLGAIGSGGAPQIAAGGDLYHLAAKSYGDATEWAHIAAANGLSDPVIGGVRQITIPPLASGGDGLTDI
jgi:hypothetical protein